MRLVSCFSVSTVKCSNPWQGSLCHVNLQSNKRMMNLDLILTSSINMKEKCQVCVQAKQCKKSIKSVEKNTQLLLLIHSEIYEYNSVFTQGHKEIFISFIDDFSKWCYVYIISHKLESIKWR